MFIKYDSNMITLFLSSAKITEEFPKIKTRTSKDFVSACKESDHLSFKGYLILAIPLSIVRCGPKGPRAFRGAIEEASIKSMQR